MRVGAGECGVRVGVGVGVVAAGEGDMAGGVVVGWHAFRWLRSGVGFGGLG